MILRDKVELIARVAGEPDRYGNPTWTEQVVGTVPADVRSVSTALNLEVGRTQIVDQLRAVLPPLDVVATATKVRWRGQDYTFDGTPEQHVRGGRLHHYSVPLALVSG